MPTDDILSVKRRHSLDLLGRPGVSGVGVEKDAAGRDVFALHVSTDDPGVLAGLPSEIEGYPVRIVRSGPFRAFDARG
ncbi:MAG: hypothetical protein ACJ8GN_18120 [Longimicrobiaceae bacterium]